QCARVRATDGLRDECDYALCAARANGRVELAGEAHAIRFRALVSVLVAIGVARRDMLDVDQKRRELAPPPRVAAHRQRAQRIPVVALAPGDEDAALKLPDLDEVLARHLERGFDRFRAP